MILPTQFLPAERSLISIGGEVLVVLKDGPQSVSAVWDRMNPVERRHPLSFDWFALALSLLFSLGLLELEDELLHLRKPQ